MAVHSWHVFPDFSLDFSLSVRLHELYLWLLKKVDSVIDFFNCCRIDNICVWAYALYVLDLRTSMMDPTLIGLIGVHVRDVVFHFYSFDIWAYFCAGTNVDVFLAGRSFEFDFGRLGGGKCLDNDLESEQTGEFIRSGTFRRVGRSRSLHASRQRKTKLAPTAKERSNSCANSVAAGVQGLKED